MNGSGYIPYWFLVVALPFYWPLYLTRPGTVSAELVVAAVLLVVAEIAAARWLSGGRLVRTAAYAGAMLFLPPLLLWIFSGKRSPGPDAETDTIPPDA
jgi:hypothetical protein